MNRNDEVWLYLPKRETAPSSNAGTWPKGCNIKGPDEHERESEEEERERERDLSMWKYLDLKEFGLLVLALGHIDGEELKVDIFLKETC